MKFYEICVEDKYTFYSVISTGDGQVLRTDFIYKSGLTGHIIFDHSVKVPSSWMDAKTSYDDLSYTTTDFLLRNYLKGHATVEEVSFNLPYKKIIPCKGLIGDRKIIKPQNVLAYLHNHLVSA